MAKKAPLFMGTVVAAMATVGVIALSTCVNNKKSPEPTAPTVDTPAAPALPKATTADNTEHPVPSATATRRPRMDERLTPIMAELVAKFEKHEGITATVKTELAQSPGGNAGSTAGKGIYDCKRRDGKLLINFWLTNTLQIYTETNNYVTGEIIDDLYDGEFLYKRLQQTELKQLFKRNYSPDGILQIGGQGLFQSLIAKNDLTLLADEEVNGSPTYVIEATPLSGGWKSKHHFDKQTGLRMKFVETDEAGKKQVALELSEIKLNPEFGLDVFLPKMPKGFTFIDETMPAGPQP